MCLVAISEGKKEIEVEQGDIKNGKINNSTVITVNMNQNRGLEKMNWK
jgi:hypothetical protein